MTSYKDSGKIVQWTNASTAVVSGAVIVIGAILAIAQNAIANGVTGAVFVSGRFSVTKPNDEAWTAGQRIYWDSSAENFTTTVTAYFAGCAAAAAAETAVVGYILLNDGCPVAPVAATSSALTDSTGGVAATTLPAAAAATSATLTDSSGGTAADTVAEITNSANAGSADVAPVANAVATFAREQAALAADILAVRGEIAVLAASLAAQTNALRADMVSAKLIRG